MMQIRNGVLVFLILITVPCVSIASAMTCESGGYQWTFEDEGGAYVTAVSPEPVGRVVIPAGLSAPGGEETFPVTHLGPIFRGCTNLTEVVLPPSVTSIDAGAFDDSPNLSFIATLIGGNGTYFSKDGVLYSGDPYDVCQIERVPEGYTNSCFNGLVCPRVGYIAEGAFRNCVRIRQVNLKKAVETDRRWRVGQFQPLCVLLAA